MTSHTVSFTCRRVFSLFSKQRRSFHVSSLLRASDDHPDVSLPTRPQRATDIAHRFAANYGESEESETVRVTFIEASGRRVSCIGMTGQNLLHLAGSNSVDIVTTCAGSLHHSCPGCHVIIPEEWMHRLTASSLFEDRQLDRIQYTRWNSRLACQIKLDKTLDGIVIGVGPIRVNTGMDDVWVGRDEDPKLLELKNEAKQEGKEGL